jgi:hypothetical protein
MTPGPVAGCDENIIDTVVFVRFHSFSYLVNCMIRSDTHYLLGLAEMVLTIHFVFDS